MERRMMVWFLLSLALHFVVLQPDLNANWEQRRASSSPPSGEPDLIWSKEKPDNTESEIDKIIQNIKTGIEIDKNKVEQETPQTHFNKMYDQDLLKVMNHMVNEIVTPKTHGEQQNIPVLDKPPGMPIPFIPPEGVKLKMEDERRRTGIDNLLRRMKGEKVEEEMNMPEETRNLIRKLAEIPLSQKRSEEVDEYATETLQRNYRELQRIRRVPAGTFDTPKPPKSLEGSDKTTFTEYKRDPSHHVHQREKTDERNVEKVTTSDDARKLAQQRDKMLNKGFDEVMKEEEQSLRKEYVKKPAVVADGETDERVQFSKKNRKEQRQQNKQSPKSSAFLELNSTTRLIKKNLSGKGSLIALVVVWCLITAIASRFKRFGLFVVLLYDLMCTALWLVLQHLTANGNHIFSLAWEQNKEDYNLLNIWLGTFLLIGVGSHMMPLMFGASYSIAVSIFCLFLNILVFFLSLSPVINGAKPSKKPLYILFAINFGIISFLSFLQLILFKENKKSQKVKRTKVREEEEEEDDSDDDSEEDSEEEERERRRRKIKKEKKKVKEENKSKKKSDKEKKQKHETKKESDDEGQLKEETEEDASSKSKNTSTLRKRKN